jgi:hypothetical protein
MKGFLKIGSGELHSSKECVEDNDNYELDGQIRSVVHFVIIEETTKSGCEDYYVVIYKKVGEKQ